MKFSPKSEKEIAEMNLWPAAVYPFEIIEATDEVSKSNNEMIKLKVHVFNQQGEAIILFDYLLESMAYKLRHCSDVCGVLSKYEKGELVAGDFIGKTGSAKITVQKDKNGQYPDKNTIADYIVQKSAADSVPVQAPVLKDEIPF